MLSIALAWYAMQVISATPPVVITALPDGVSIKGAEDLRQIVASWDVYVTLDPPIFPDTVADHVNGLGSTFAALLGLQDQGIEIKLDSQDLRRKRLLAQVNMAAPRRSKRGLLDAGGYVLSALFGVATTAQLHRFQEALQEIGTNQGKLVHAHNHLASVVNQTRAFVAQLAVDQGHLEAHVAGISRSIRKIVRMVNDNTRRIARLEIITDLDRYIDVLDLAVDHYVRQTTLFHRQRSELEMGRLTRDLLPEEQLREILSQATGRYKVIGEMEWYYQFLSVAPLWQNTDKLLYKIELPLIAPRPYLLYQVMTHPVPISNSSYTIHVQLESSYAIDTVSGNLFVPQRCLGHDPTVCQTGPEYGPSMLTCARGLITNQTELMKTCKVEIKDYTGESVIKLVDINQYAIASFGENLVVRCPGETEQHFRMSKGTHNVTCLKPCTISSSGWTVTCIDRMHLARRYVMPKVEVTTNFNFSTNIVIEKLKVVLPELALKATPRILQTDISSILQPLKLKPLTKLPSNISFITYFNAGCTAAFWILIALTCLRWRRWRMRLSQKLSNSQPEQLPLTAPAAPQGETPTRAGRSIWPLLPPLSECFSQPIIQPTNLETNQ